MPKIIINGKGLDSLKKPNKVLYLGNSGTSATTCSRGQNNQRQKTF